MVWLLLIVSVVLLIGFTKVATRKALIRTGNRMNAFFAALDPLTERGVLPDEWKGAALRSAKTGEKKHLIKKLDELYVFFAKCPFVEDHQTRNIILSKLDVIMDEWEELEVSALLVKYGISGNRPMGETPDGSRQ